MNLSGTARKLWDKIETREARIGVVGLGYVGLPLAVEYAGHGFKTLGIDLNRERVLRLNAGQNYIQDVAGEDLARVVEAGTFVAEDDFSSSGEVDIFYICVPTPVNANKDPDTSYIESAACSIAAHLRCIESGRSLALLPGVDHSHGYSKSVARLPTGAP